MKKYTLSLFILAFVLGSFSINVNSVKAFDTEDSGCRVGDMYSRTTGKACGAPTFNECSPGDLFNVTTGQPCPVANGGGGSGGSQDNPSDSVTEFSKLFKSNFKIGSRGDDVKALQQFLKDEDYYFGKIDGKYGRITARAVKDFQDDNDIAVASGGWNSGGPGTGTTVSQSPIINGVSGPQTLIVNQTGIWIVKASSPTGGNLLYSVIWGDEKEKNLAYNQPEQSATFTHSYSQVGTYTPTFTVTNEEGQTAKISLSVEVRDATSVYPQTITQPSASTVWKMGTQQIVRWTNISLQDPHIPKIIVLLSRPNGSEKMNISDQKDGYFPYLGSYPIGSDFSGVKVNVPQLNVGDGNYGIFQIVLASADNTPNDLDDNRVLSEPVLFTIEKSGATPSITVLSPNGGEKFVKGQTMQINWSQQNIDKVSIGLTRASLLNQSVGVSYYIVSNYPVNMNSKTGSYSYTIPANTLSSDIYKLWIIGYRNGVEQANDRSDAVFSIVSGTTSPSLTVLSPNGGEKLEFGKTYTIKWKSSGIPSNANIDIEIGSSNYGNSLIRSNTINDGSEELIFNSDPILARIGVDSYIQISWFCGSNCIVHDRSDALFSIVTSTTPAITVLSPNGGEKFVQRQVNKISWSGGKDAVQIGLVDESATNNVNPAGQPYLIKGWISVSEASDSSYSWEAKKVCDSAMMNCQSVVPGNYKIIAVSKDANGNFTLWDGINNKAGNWDVSDAPFSIVAAGTAQKAALTASVESLPSFATVAGSANVEFAKFTFDATQSSEDVIITSIPVIMEASLAGSQSKITNLHLVFNNGTPTGGNIINPFGNGRIADIVFNINPNIPFIVGKGTKVTVALEGSISGLAETGLTYRFGLASDAKISAIGFVSGATVVPTVIANPGHWISVVSNGSYSVSLDPASPSYREVAAGSGNVELARLKFTASYENIDIKQVAFQLSGTNPNPLLDLVGGRITLYDGAGATKIGEALFVSPTKGKHVAFVVLTGFTIPVGGSKTMIIKGDIAASNDPLTVAGDILKVDYDGDANGFPNGNYGVGLSSATNISPTNSPDTHSAGVKIMEASGGGGGGGPTSPPIPVPSSLTVLSPNGGEKFVPGQTMQINWSQQNIDKVSIGLTRASLLNQSVGISYVVSNHPVNINSTTGSYSYTIPANTLSSDIYKLWIIGYRAGVEQANDRSDAVFSIIAAPVVSDLEMKNVSRSADFHPYGFSAEYRMNGPKSINDLKQENPKITNMPASYYVYNSQGARYRGDASCGGSCESLKNSQDSGKIMWTIASEHQSIYDQTKKVDFVLDPDNLIRETNENNNKYVFVDTPTPPPSIPAITVLAPNGRDIIIDPLQSTPNAMFTANVTGGSGRYKYYWDLGDGTIINDSVFSFNQTIIGHRYSAPGAYTVSVYVVDSNNQKSNIATVAVTARLANTTP